MSDKNNEWPKTLWILTGDDIIKRNYSHGNRHCLVGWMNNQFRHRNSSYRQITDKFKDKLRNNLIKLGSTRYAYDSIETHNDKGLLSNDQLAEAWNMTLADFGYIEIDKSEWKDYE